MALIRTVLAQSHQDRWSRTRNLLDPIQRLDQTHFNYCRTWFDDLEFKYESVKTHLEHCFQELEHVDTDSDLGRNGEISSLSKMRPS